MSANFPVNESTIGKVMSRKNLSDHGYFASATEINKPCFPPYSLEFMCEIENLKDELHYLQIAN